MEEKLREIIDTRFNHVYCTNCIHWNKLLNCIENEDEITPTPCCVCFPYNPEDSTERIKRPQYKEIEVSI